MEIRLSNAISVIRIVSMYWIVAVNYLNHIYQKFYDANYLESIGNTKSFMETLNSGSLIDKLSVQFAFAGGGGVVMLAIISGFALWWSFEKAGRFDIGKYVISRVSRTYVPYLIAVFVSLIVGFFFLNIEFNRWTIAVLFSGSARYNIPAYNFNPPFWYITMLLGCYTLFPVLIHIFNRFKIYGVIAFTAIVWIIYYLVRLPFNFTYIDIDPFYPIMPFFTMFSIGAIACYAVLRLKDKLKLLGIIAVPITALLVIWFTFIEPLSRESWSMNNVYWFGIICSVLFGSIGYLLPERWHNKLMFVSRGTMAVFLFHYLLVPFITEHTYVSITVVLVSIYVVFLVVGSFYQKLIDNTVVKFTRNILSREVKIESV